MTAEIKTLQKVLAVADATDRQTAVESAAALAERHGAALEVIVCIEPPRDLALLSRLSGAEPEGLIAEAAERTRAAVRARLSKVMGRPPAEPAVTVGKAYPEVIRHAAATGADFVVKAAAPLSGIDRCLLASTDQHLLRKCPCPVWLQTPTATARPARVVAAVDLDLADAPEPETLAALNRRVIDTACLIAGDAAPEVEVLHVWDAPGEGMIWAFTGDCLARLSADCYAHEILATRQDEMNRLLAEVRQEQGSAPRLVPRLVRGAPEVAIRDRCRVLGADVVVLGTVARTGLSGMFIGNTAEDIINNLGCPVVAVKPDGFVSPLLRG